MLPGTPCMLLAATTLNPTYITALLTVDQQMHLVVFAEGCFSHSHEGMVMANAKFVIIKPGRCLTDSPKAGRFWWYMLGSEAR
mmetsp:Transcript_24036/g.34916  ORF Transcript_24036/g.34916 Transcript_24036/m.34916 type:complete len:83 (+) Transcript_24036:708-956(+)